MKLLEKETVHVARPRAFAPALPAAPPRVAIRARVVERSVPGRPTKSSGEVLNRIVAFAFILGVTYVGSTLMGYVALERARQGVRQGAERAAFARAEARLARVSIENLTDPAMLHAWADAHGFVAGGALEAPKSPAVRSGLVARR